VTPTSANPRTPTPPKPGLVVVLDVDGDEETYLLGSREDSHDEHEILSANSPMGEAVTGAAPARRSASRPRRASIEVTVKEIRTP
jgi:transcription elongation factor GreA